MAVSAPERRDLARALRAIVGERVSEAPIDRIAYARDLWPRALLALGDGAASPWPPDVIVWPEQVEEVAALVRWAAAHRVPIVPFGGGSGVCGAAAPIRGGIVIDLKRMNRTLSIDTDALEASFEAGILGEHLEHQLSRRGLTLGHFPSSIHISTLGGWLAARSAGQLSTKYGAIEDMTLGLEVVTGRGDVLALPGSAQTFDWRALFIGSEGVLGIITSARLRVRPAPALRLLRGYALPDVPHGLEAIRRVLQRGVRPAVVRLYDERETFVHSSSRGSAHDEHGLSDLEEKTAETRGLLLRVALASPRLLNRILGKIGPRLLGPLTSPAGSGCLLIVGFEGDPHLTQAEASVAAVELARSGGRDLGPEPGERWLLDRYKVSFQQSKIFDNGAFVDTMEVATTWDRLLDLYTTVRQAMEPHALVLAHFSHAYSEGCSIYFTFIAHGRDRVDAERRYDLIWRSGIRATLASGGVLSHHHGVGMSKQRYLPEEQGEAMELYRGLKEVLDPAGILNPGKMGLG